MNCHNTLVVNSLIFNVYFDGWGVHFSRAVMFAFGGFMIICVVCELWLLCAYGSTCRAACFRSSSGRPVERSPSPSAEKEKHTQTDTNMHTHHPSNPSPPQIPPPPPPSLSQLQLLIFSVQAAACLSMCVRVCDGDRQSVCVCVRASMCVSAY